MDIETREIKMLEKNSIKEVDTSKEEIFSDFTIESSVVEIEALPEVTIKIKW